MSALRAIPPLISPAPSLAGLTHHSQRPFTLDFFQLLRFVCLNLMTAPPNYHWQQFLERSFPAYIDPRPASADASGHELKPTNPDGGPSPAALEAGAGASVPEPKFSLRNTLTKWFVDCITLGAIMNTMAFLVIMGAMKGQGLGQIYYNIQTVRLTLRRHSATLFVSVSMFSSL